MKDFHVVLVGPKSGDPLSEPRQPLGVGYLAAVLEKEGVSVTVFDPNVQDITPRILFESSPDVIGFSCITRTFEWSIRLAKSVKMNSQAFIVLGGPHVTLVGDELLHTFPFIDGIIRGEGEITLSELVHALDEGNPLDIKGLSYRTKTEVVRNPPRPFLQSLDDVPFPARHLLPSLADYHFLATLLSSRGCPYNCAFCCVNLVFSEEGSRKWRARSPQNIVRELVFLEELGAHHVYFADDNFLVDMKRVLTLIDLIKEYGVSLSFSFGCRADQIIYFKDHLSALNHSGCVNVEIGVENGCQAVLDRYSKGITVEQNRKALHLLEENKINAKIDYILFDAETTLEELETNMNFIKKNNLEFHDEIFVNTLYLTPGSKIHARYAKNRWIQKTDYGLDYAFHHGDAARIQEILVHYILTEGRKAQILIRRIRDDLIILAGMARKGMEEPIHSFFSRYYLSKLTLKRLPFVLFEKCLDSYRQGSEPCESELFVYCNSVLSREEDVITALHEELHRYRPPGSHKQPGSGA